MLPWDGTPPVIDTVADPLTGNFFVLVDGEIGLFAGDPPDVGAMTPGTGFTVDPIATPICDDLAARLGGAG